VSTVYYLDIFEKYLKVYDTVNLGDKSQLIYEAQCARTDLNKRFLPKPMTTTG
jgi:hypothetical protein